MAKQTDAVADKPSTRSPRGRAKDANGDGGRQEGAPRSETNTPQAERLIYIRQMAPGIGSRNSTFSVPEIDDFKSRATTIAAFGDFSTVDFTLIGFGREPRLVKAGVVNGSFFDVMGLRPVLGRLLNTADDGPTAAGVVAGEPAQLAVAESPSGAVSSAGLFSVADDLSNSSEYETQAGREGAGGATDAR